MKSRDGIIKRAERMVQEMGFLLSKPKIHGGGIYDSIAPLYEDFRALWMLAAGRAAEEAMMDDLAVVIRPGARILDAGCGTGAITNQILQAQPNCEVTMLDMSSPMLAEAKPLHSSRVLGDVCRLPFDDETFDVVACAWTIETVEDPFSAVREMLRVLTPDGQLVYTFSAVPGGCVSQAGTALLRSILHRHFGGRLRPAESSPWHDCERSHRVFFQGGTTVEVALRKCCRVEAGVLPP